MGSARIVTAFELEDLISANVTQLLELQDYNLKSILHALNLSDIRGGDFRNCDWQEQDLKGLDFSFCNLTGVDFSGAMISGCRFHRTEVDASALMEASDWDVYQTENEVHSKFLINTEALSTSISLKRPDEIREYIDRLKERGDLTPSFLMKSIVCGQVEIASHAVSAMAEMSVEQAKLLIADGDGLGLRVLFKRTGLHEKLMPAFRQAVHVANSVNEPNFEYTRVARCVERVMTQFVAIPDEDLEYLVDVLDHSLWRSKFERSETFPDVSKDKHHAYFEALVSKNANRRMLSSAAEIEHRLAPVLTAEGISNTGELQRMLEDRPNRKFEKEIVSRLLLDPGNFFHEEEVLTRAIYDTWQRFNSDRSQLTYRVLCIEDSNFKEAVSAAILLKELGVDLEQCEVSSGRLYGRQSNVYPPAFDHYQVQRGVSINRLLDNFVATDGFWGLSEDIARIVKSPVCSFIQSGTPPKIGFNLVVCRGTIISTLPAARNQLIASLKGLLSPDGVLLTSLAEIDLLRNNSNTNEQEKSTTGFSKSA